jgi:hypothetical protein
MLLVRHFGDNRVVDGHFGVEVHRTVVAVSLLPSGGSEVRVFLFLSGGGCFLFLRSGFLRVSYALAQGYLPGVGGVVVQRGGDGRRQ